jgi:hypothetical protein
MTNRESRERFIELFSPFADSTHFGGGTIVDGTKVEDVVDHLIANGVMVPPCKVGDSIFRVGNSEIWEWLIEHIEIYEDEICFVDDGENYFTPDKIGKTVFLTKEAAEKALKECKKI